VDYPDLRGQMARRSIELSASSGTAGFGFGNILLLFGLTNYLIDISSVYASSALASTIVLRSIGAILPLITPDMYARLGIYWASSVPAILSLACVSIPILLIFMVPGSVSNLNSPKKRKNCRTLSIPLIRGAHDEVKRMFRDRASQLHSQYVVFV
jgi:hypothetical protein